MEIKKMGHPPSIKLGDNTTLMKRYAIKRSVKSLKKSLKSRVSLPINQFEKLPHFGG